MIWLYYEKSKQYIGGCQVSSSKKGRDNLTKSVFQSSLGLIIMSLGLAEECIPANRFCKTEIFDLVVLRKKCFGGC